MRYSLQIIIMVALMLVIAGCKRDHYYDVPDEDPPSEEPYNHDHGDPKDPNDPDDPDDPNDPNDPDNPNDPDSPDNPEPPDNPDSPDTPSTTDLITMASVLTGQWHGTLSTKYYDDNGQLWQGVYDTDFLFERKTDDAYEGQGLETDYEKGKMVYASPFSWAIDAKTEDIHLRYDDGRVMTICTFHLDNHSFYGTIKSNDGKETDEFNLQKID